MIEFNINGYIHAKLTDHGREIHKANHERIFHGYLGEKYPYQAPEEDADGWSKWQMWYFMATFGPHMGNGLDNPAHTVIKIQTEGE